MTGLPAQCLVEGDAVRLLGGPHRGRTALIVGFDVLSEAVIVQHSEAVDGLIREPMPAADLAIVMKAPESLEPLPVVAKLLMEDAFAPVLMTCGRMVCLTLNEDGTVLTCVPKTSLVRLRQVFESRYRRSMKSAVEAVLRTSFITRLPHLVTVGRSDVISKHLTEGACVDDLLRELRFHETPGPCDAPVTPAVYAGLTDHARPTWKGI